MQIDAIRQIIQQAIKGTPFEGLTYFAGGCVRDFLLRRETTDFDLAVELNRGGIRLAEHLYSIGVSTKPVTYPRYGTAKLTISGQQVELVMTRSEIYTPPSRYPKVRFASLYEDTMRRDFTINALYMQVADGNILDLSGKGRADLQERIIRATGNPRLVFREDPLRMLRAIRFAVTLGFSIDQETALGIKSSAEEILHLSDTSRALEIGKIIKSENHQQGIALLQEFGLIPENNPV